MLSTLPVRVAGEEEKQISPSCGGASCCPARKCGIMALNYLLVEAHMTLNSV